MTKGKYQRKKHHAQDRARQKAAEIALMDAKEETTDKKEKPTNNSTKKATGGKEPPWWPSRHSNDVQVTHFVSVLEESANRQNPCVFTPSSRDSLIRQSKQIGHLMCIRSPSFLP